MKCYTFFFFFLISLIADGPHHYQIGARKRRTPENTILSQPYCRRVSTNRPNREGSQLAASLEGEPGPTPAGKTLPHSYPETRFRRERAREVCGHKGSSHLSPVHALHFFYRDASSALLQLVNQWLNFTYSRSHAFRYERKNTNPALVRIELTTSALAGVRITY